MDIFVGVRLPNPYGREDLAPTRSPTSCFYQTHVILVWNLSLFLSVSVGCVEQDETQQLTYV